MLARIMPYFVLGLFIVIFVVGIVLLSYLFIFAAIIGLILFAIAWIRAKLLHKPSPGNPINMYQKKSSTNNSAKQSPKGRVFEHDEIN